MRRRLRNRKDNNTPLELQLMLAILLKTPQRIEALLMLMHVALLVSSLLQYRLRKGRKAWSKPVPKIGWNGAFMMEAPTTYYIESHIPHPCRMEKIVLTVLHKRSILDA